MFYNSSNSFQYNDCVSRGACSISPDISSMQEIMFIILRQIAYYLIKLEEAGVIKNDVTNDLISEIALIDAAKDLTESQILNSFSKEYNNLVQVRKDYIKLCNDKNFICTDLKNLVKLSPKTSLSSILKLGNRAFMQKYKQLNSGRKYFSEILFSIIKSVCTNLIYLQEYGKDNIRAKQAVLECLNIFNGTNLMQEKIKSGIDRLAKIDLELLKNLFENQEEIYGEIFETEVCRSTSPNKAIMVSGSNLHDLASLLKSVKNTDIDVYTNGNLLIAHAFPYFKKFVNLKGHFGSGIFNTILDFATFPGAILLTKNESQYIEYLYRGRLFTTDDIAPVGVVKIENNNFTPVITSANHAKGFAKGRQKESETVGCDINKLMKKFDEILNKNPDRIFIIGFSNFSFSQQEYFKNFFNMLPANSFALSFSYNPELENVITLNIGNNYAVMCAILQKIYEKIPVHSEKLVFFMTKCDISSLSYTVNLKNKGAKNIFLSECPPMVINPVVLKSFINIYGMCKMTTPKQDFDEIKKREI